MGVLTETDASFLHFWEALEQRPQNSRTFRPSSATYHHFLLFIMCFILYTSSSVSAECIVSLPGVSGVFDLSSLQGSVWTAHTASNDYSFEFSVCGAVPHCSGHTNASVCQQWIGGEASCGAWDPAQIEVISLPSGGTSGVGLVVKNGDEVH